MLESCPTFEIECEVLGAQEALNYLVTIWSLEEIWASSQNFATIFKEKSEFLQILQVRCFCTALIPALMGAGGQPCSAAARGFLRQVSHGLFCP